MDKLVHVVLSSLRLTSLSQRTTTSNLANVETVGFRADDTATFQAAYLAQGGEQTSRVYPTAAPQSISTRSGPLESTGNPLDVAVNGSGYLVVQAPDGSRVLSRRGDLHVGPGQQLVNGSGEVVIGDNGAIVVPPYREISITNDGTVNIIPIDAEADAPLQSIGRLGLVAQPRGLRRREDGNIESADGQVPPFDPNVTVMSGQLERSNVNSVEILGKMVELSRLFEAQTKVLKTASTMDEVSTSLMRLPD